jgi:hypothetical protein
LDRGHGADLGLLRFERNAVISLLVCGNPNISDTASGVATVGLAARIAGLQGLEHETY